MLTHNQVVDFLCRSIAIDAAEQSLLPKGAQIKYSPGSKVNGIAPSLYIVLADNYRSASLLPSFLPEWTLKTNRREVEKTLQACSNVFAAFRKRDADEADAMDEDYSRNSPER